MIDGCLISRRMDDWMTGQTEILYGWTIGKNDGWMDE